MDKQMTHAGVRPVIRIGRSRRLLFISTLLTAAILLSSCEARWRYNADLYRMRDFTNAIEEEFGELSIKDIAIDDEEKSFSITYTGPETIAEFDQIREMINDYLIENPDFFLHDGYSITVNFKTYIGRVNYVNSMITNKKNPFDEKNNELYENLSFMEIQNGPYSSYEISQLEGHCTTLKGIGLDGIKLNDLAVLKNLPALESVMLVSTYSGMNLRTVQATLPDFEVTLVRQSV